MLVRRRLLLCILLTVVSTAPLAGQGAGTFLSSGETVTFLLPVVSGPALFTGGYRIQSPPGARSIRIELESPTPNADLDLFVRFGEDIGPTGAPESDYQSENDGTSTEVIVIDPTSDPPLQTGFYFIGFLLEATTIPVIGRITVTVDADDAPAVGTLLTTGAPAQIAIPALPAPIIGGGELGFRVNVPAGSDQLRIQVTIEDPEARFQILARQGFDVQVQDGNTFSDWATGVNAGTGTLTITSASPPQLIPGTIFIALGLESVGTPFMGTITATVTAGNPPALSVSPTALEFNGIVGGAPLEMPFTVQNVGGGRLRYVIEADQPWITLRPPNGTSDGEAREVRVEADLTGLGVGEHTASVTVSTEDGSDRQTVTVRLLLTNPGNPAIELSESSVEFEVSPGEQAAKGLTIRNSGGGRLEYRIASNVGWLTPNIFSGVSTGEADPFTLTADSAGLEVGFYEGRVRFRADQANLTEFLPVQLRVRGGAPAVFSTANELRFSAVQFGEPPAAQLFSMGNSGEGQLRYQITTDQPWLSVTPDAGVLIGDLTIFRAMVDPTGLDAGAHEASIRVDGQALGAIGRADQVAPLIIRVMLTVTAGVPRPAVADNGVLNAASFVLVGNEGHAVAPGSIVTIFGTDFADGVSAATTLPLPLALGGVSATFNGLPAPLFAVTNLQINAQLPSGLTGTQATVVVTGPGGASVAKNVQILPYSPAIFSFTQQGSGQGIVTFAAPPEDAGQLVAPAGLGGSRPGRAGDIITIWINGLGPVDPPVLDGRNSFDPEGFRLRTAVTRPTVRIGLTAVPDANILFAGLAPEFVGVFQINLTLPAGLVSGPGVPIVVEVGGVRSRGDITIAIE